jgi:hypothetical protein
MSSKAKPDGPKFGLMDRLKKPEGASAEQPAVVPVPAADTGEAGEVKFTSYLDADLSRRLQIHVATKKAQKKRGQERVSIKSVLDQALREYLERHHA